MKFCWRGRNWRFYLQLIIRNSGNKLLDSGIFHFRTWSLSPVQECQPESINHRRDLSQKSSSQVDAHGTTIGSLVQDFAIDQIAFSFSFHLFLFSSLLLSFSFFSSPLSASEIDWRKKYKHKSPNIENTIYPKTCYIFHGYSQVSTMQNLLQQINRTFHACRKGNRYIFGLTIDK